MKSWVRTILYFLAVILITASVTAGITVSILNQQREDVVVLSAEEYAEISQLLFLDEIIERVQSESLNDPPSREELLNAAAEGIVTALDDPYAAYYTARNMKRIFPTSMGSIMESGFSWANRMHRARQCWMYMMKRRQQRQEFCPVTSSQR